MYFYPWKLLSSEHRKSYRERLARQKSLLPIIGRYQSNLPTDETIKVYLDIYIYIYI